MDLIKLKKSEKHFANAARLQHRLKTHPKPTRQSNPFQRLLLKYFNNANLY